MIDLQNKKGLSTIIGYVLLVSAVIAISVVVFSWLKTYIPSVDTGTTQCPEGTSLYIKNVNCTKESENVYKLKVELKNNGRFSIGGYHIFATNNTEAVATFDLSKLNETGNPVLTDFQLWMHPGVKFFSTEEPNSLNPGESIFTEFGLNNTITSVTIFPIRWEDSRPISCGDKRVKAEVQCK